MLNPQESILDRIKKTDKRTAKSLDYSGIEFSIKEKDHPMIDHRFSINLNVFTTINELTHYISHNKTMNKCQMYY